MRQAPMLVPALFALLAGGFVACGGSTESIDFENADPGGGDVTADAGDAGNDGEDASTVEEGGADEDGGVDAESDADIPDAPDFVDGGDEPLPPCPGPVDDTKAALCLAIDPEEIAFLANDERFDGKGILYVSIYDKANPSDVEAPLQTHIAPGQPGTGYATKSLAELTATPIRFDGLPETVYARVFFVDDVEGAKPDTLVPGTWVGGLALSNGFVENAPIEPITLEKGKGTTVKLSLAALRKLTVEVSRSANPAQGGNAQGPLTVIALASQNLDPQQMPNIFGLGELPCADVSGSKKATVEGVVFGKGPYWVTGLLNDFNGAGQAPPGSLVSAQISGLSLKVPDSNKLDYAADAYTVSHSISLNFAVPGQTGPDNASCP